MRKYIRLFGGHLIGYTEDDPAGNKTVYSSTGLIVSKYNASNDTTYDFYGKIIATGDVASGMLLLKDRGLI